MDGIEYPAASTVDRAPRPAEVRAATGAAQRVLVQPGRNAFPDMTAFLVERFGFELVQLTDYDGHLAQSKMDASARPGTAIGGIVEGAAAIAPV